MTIDPTTTAPVHGEFLNEVEIQNRSSLAVDQVSFRRATEGDREFIIRMNHLTETWGDEDATRGRDFTESDHRYVGLWEPRQGGVIADRGGVPIGAAWLRTFTAEDPGTGFVADAYPEVAIAVEPDHSGGGVGRRLLQAVLDQAQADGHPGVSLCVEDGNHRAQGLYEKTGFRHVTTTESGGSRYMVMVYVFD